MPLNMNFARNCTAEEASLLEEQEVCAYCHSMSLKDSDPGPEGQLSECQTCGAIFFFNGLGPPKVVSGPQDVKYIKKMVESKLNRKQWSKFCWSALGVICAICSMPIIAVFGISILLITKVQNFLNGKVNQCSKT